MDWEKFKDIDYFDDLVEEMSDSQETLEKEEPQITFFRGDPGNSDFIGWKYSSRDSIGLLRLEDAGIEKTAEEIRGEMN